MQRVLCWRCVTLRLHADGTPDSQSNLCCMGSSVINTITNAVDSSKSLKNGSTSKCSDVSSGVYDYTQARVSAFPTYTEIIVEDPWLEMFNAVGGILALIDTGTPAQFPL